MGKILYLLQSESIKQLIKYGFVGLSGLIIELCLFYLLVKVLDVHYFFSNSLSFVLNNTISPERIDQNISHVISSVIAIINNFILNSYFTFKVKDDKCKRFISFLGIALIGLIISTILFDKFNKILGEDLIMVSKMLAIGIVVVFQFGFNKFFTFRKKRTKL